MSNNVHFFRVGGCVRDSLLGIDSKDIDFTVVAPSFEAMVEACRARCTKLFGDDNGNLVGADYYTLRGIDPNIGDVDFVWARKDGPYSDGRRPDWVEPGTLHDDLARRDFTVNAMAIDDDGTLIDPFEGRIDLEHRTLRFVGTAEERLAEDALRAFRGVRFEITKGFHLDTQARIAILAMGLDQFDAVSTQRIREELQRAFAHDSDRAMEALSRYPNLAELTFERGIWLDPTVKVRNKVETIRDRACCGSCGRPL